MIITFCNAIILLGMVITTFIFSKLMKRLEPFMSVCKSFRPNSAKVGSISTPSGKDK